MSPASTASGPNPAVSVNPSPNPVLPTNSPSSNPTIPVTPNPRAQFTSGNRLGMRQSRTFSAQEELNRISNDLNPNSTTPTAPVGDIILGGEKPKKNKKPLIFALVGVAIVAVIGVVAALLLKNGNIIKSPEMVLREKFNLYANYMLYGEDSTTDIKDKEYSPGNTYQLGKIQSSLSDKESTNKALDEYFTKAEEKFSNFYDEYKKTGKTDLKKILEEYDNRLDLFHHEKLVRPILIRNIMSIHTHADAKANYEEYFNSQYKKYYSSKKQYTKDFINNYKTNFLGIIELLKKYDQFKCFDRIKKMINNFCLNSKNINFVSLKREYDNYMKYFFNLISEENEQPRYIFRSIWQIKKGIYEEE